MQIVNLNHPTSRLSFEPQNKIKIRKIKTMFFELLRKFFWMKSPIHRHSIDHLSDHLKRDMGLIEPDMNPKPRANDRFSPKIQPSLWL